MRLSTKPIATIFASPVGVIFLCGFFWSFSGVLIKLLDCNAFLIAGARGGIAATVQLFYIWKTGTKFRLPKLWPEWLAVVAFVTNTIVLVFAFQLTSAANAVFLHYSGLVLVAFLAPHLLKETTTRHDWLAVLLALTGIYLLAGTQLEPRAVLGNCLGIICGITLAATNLCWRHIGKTGKHVDVLNAIIVGDIITFSICMLTIVFFVPAGDLRLNSNCLQNSVLFIALGIIPWALPNILFCRVIDRVQAVRAMIASALDPILTAVWPMFVLAEFPTLWGYLGCILILGAVIASQYAELKGKARDDLVPSVPEKKKDKPVIASTVGGRK
jgi:drug/metabolite transporter, DME family